MKFEEGKWYKFKYWHYGEKDLCKCILSTNRNDVLHIEEIRNGKYIKCKENVEWYGEMNEEYAIEANPEDYLPYLPENHPDKKKEIIIGEQKYDYLKQLLEKLNIK